MKEISMNLSTFLVGFRYKADGKIDSYRILKNPKDRGDCDDFAITVLWILSGKSVWTLLKNLAKGDMKVVRSFTSRGERHAMAWVKDSGYIDNIYPTFRSWPIHMVRHTASFPRVVLKMTIGMLQTAFGKVRAG